MAAPGWTLKLGATAITLLATLGSAGFVGGHMKPASAPLHPTVIGVQSTARPSKLTITPSVRSTDVAPVTSTYAS